MTRLAASCSARLRLDPVPIVSWSTPSTWQRTVNDRRWAAPSISTSRYAGNGLARDCMSSCRRVFASLPHRRALPHRTSPPGALARGPGMPADPNRDTGLRRSPRRRRREWIRARGLRSFVRRRRAPGHHPRPACALPRRGSRAGRPGSAGVSTCLPARPGTYRKDAPRRGRSESNRRGIRDVRCCAPPHCDGSVHGRATRHR